MTPPERPRTVPDAARYVPELPGWELAGHDVNGDRHGECRLYRDDGTLERICHYDAGKRSGPFSSFHTTGEVASRGGYLDDRLDGTLFRFVSATPGGEPLRACCVPPSSVELRAEYRSGRLITEVYYDAKGRPLAGDGTPWPERPPGVPANATYDEPSKRYCERIETADGSQATLRYFAASGRIAEELSLSAGRTVGRRRFDADGELREAHGLERGVPHGASRVLFRAGHSPYTEPRLRELRGELVHGEASGPWDLVDAEGVVFRVVERGVPFVELPALVRDVEPPDVSPAELLRRAREVRGAGKAREAVCLAARASARAGDAEPLRGFLVESGLSMAPAVALERAERTANLDSVTASRLLDAVLGGEDAARLLRALPSALPRGCRASLEYLDAALLLAPERTLTRVARAFVRVEHGDRDGALGDAEAVAGESEPAAKVIREECRVGFPSYSFDPSDEPAEAPEDELLAVQVEQPLAAVRWAIMLYATRLRLLRAELHRRVGAAPFLPPDTSALLPDGPVELRTFTADISDETDDGMETTSVPVDETLAVEGKSVRELLDRARADHGALSWLCWSVGLDRIGLPNDISAPAYFAAAANRATLRCFWAHDRLRTGGLVALTRKVPTFSWRGLAIESLPVHLAEAAAAEYLEIRAQFLWLLFAQNVSPFQADLRKA